MLKRDLSSHKIAYLSFSESPLAFTHAPGCMFITDLKVEDAAAGDGKDVPEVYRICQNPLHYSITSAAAVRKIRCLEDMVGVDPGRRILIEKLYCKDLSAAHFLASTLVKGKIETLNGRSVPDNMHMPISLS